MEQDLGREERIAYHTCCPPVLRNRLCSLCNDIGRHLVLAPQATDFGSYCIEVFDHFPHHHFHLVPIVALEEFGPAWEVLPRWNVWFRFCRPLHSDSFLPRFLCTWRSICILGCESSCRNGEQKPSRCADFGLYLEHCLHRPFQLSANVQRTRDSCEGNVEASALQPGGPVWFFRCYGAVLDGDGIWVPDIWKLLLGERA
mmetsp:Transcript_5964/g.13134  ORF Transcript_5964/g.13134 Transcript_5964/m.13134 type:complete len:200 (+) Transcript_5964:636-1235(+)